MIALKWLKWLMETQECSRIRHTQNGGEVKVAGAFVDGCDDNTIYEFHGCTFHGCPKCYHQWQKRTPYGPLMMEEVFAKTKLHANTIKATGYELVEMWECDLHSQL